MLGGSTRDDIPVLTCVRRQGITPVIQTPWGWLWCGQPLVHRQRCWLAEGPLPALLRPSPDRLLPPPPLLLLLISPPHLLPLQPILLPHHSRANDGLVGSKNEQYLHLDGVKVYNKYTGTTNTHYCSLP